MRGFGALLRLQNGKGVHAQIPPDGVARAARRQARSIDHEMKISGDEFVYLDITHKDPKEVINHFPNIYQKCLSVGIDLTKDMIPVVPAAHYCCGGVKVNLNGSRRSGTCTRSAKPLRPVCTAATAWRRIR